MSDPIYISHNTVCIIISCSCLLFTPDFRPYLKPGSLGYDLTRHENSYIYIPIHIYINAGNSMNKNIQCIKFNTMYFHFFFLGFPDILVKAISPSAWQVSLALQNMSNFPIMSDIFKFFVLKINWCPSAEVRKILYNTNHI